LLTFPATLATGVPIAVKPVSTLAPETWTPVGFIDHHTVRMIGAIALPIDPPPELDPLERERGGRGRRFVRVRVEHDRREQELALDCARIQVAQEIHALPTVPTLLREAADIVALRTAAREVELVSEDKAAVVFMGGTVPEEQPVPPCRCEVLAEKRWERFYLSVARWRDIHEDAVWGYFLNSEVADSDFVVVETLKFYREWVREPERVLYRFISSTWSVRWTFGSGWIDGENCDNKRDNYSSHSGFRPNRVIITFLCCKKVKEQRKYIKQRAWDWKLIIVEEFDEKFVWFGIKS
jgi:hypothetical protein